MLRTGEAGEIDLEKALHYLQLAADKGDKESQFTVGQMMFYGEAGNKDFNMARHYYQLAADQEDKRAQTMLAWMLYFGEGEKVNLEKARKYYELAAKQGDVYAMRSYAFMMNAGEGGKADLTLALDYYKKASDLKDMQAQKTCGDMLREGRGIEKDLNKAIEYYQLAANQGSMKAKYVLAEIAAEKEQRTSLEQDVKIDADDHMPETVVILDDKNDVPSELIADENNSSDTGKNNSNKHFSEKNGIGTLLANPADTSNNLRASTQSEKGNRKSADQKPVKTAESKIGSTVYLDQIRQKTKMERPSQSSSGKDVGTLDTIKNVKAQNFVRAFFKESTEAKLSHTDFEKTLRALDATISKTKSGFKAVVQNPQEGVRAAVFSWHKQHGGSHATFDKGRFRTALMDFFHNLGLRPAA